MGKCRYVMVAAAVAGLLCGCEKQIDIDTEALEAEVVVNARGEVGEPLSARLTYSRPVFSTFYVPDGESYFKEVDDATVSLNVNGATYMATHSGGYYNFGYVPQEGDVAEISIVVSGHGVVKGNATVPQGPVLEDVELDYGQDNPRHLIYHNDVRVRFALADHANVADYYTVRLRYRDTVCFEQHLVDSLYQITDSVTARDAVVDDRYITFRCTDYAVVTNNGIAGIDIEDPDAANTFYGDEMLFTDANIGGQRHQFTLEPQFWGGDGYYDENHYDDTSHRWTNEEHWALYLEVQCISRDMYLHLSTMNAYDGGMMSSLVGEPVQIHSNMNGGIGIFAINNKRIVALAHD